nr:ribonuclease H-like domain-containing protein [Tanacetum cinerariifolium]
TNESVSDVPSVFAASAKASVSTLPNVDNLSDVVIYSFFCLKVRFDYDELNTRLSLLSHGSSDHVLSIFSPFPIVQQGPPYTGTFMPPKPDSVFHDAPPASETVPNVVRVESSTNKTSKEMSKTLRPDAPIIKDWISDSEDESEHESMSNQKEPSFVQTSEHAKTPRASVKTGNPQQALKDKDVIDSGCSRHMTGNISYLLDFEELNRGYVAFGGNPKGGKITGKGKIKTAN